MKVRWYSKFLGNVDLYTFSISELQPEQNVTCLIAKASLDESTRWHRRMAHVNFKTINKLAKEEFKNAKLIELCGEKGIKRDYSNPRTPQQNGVAERKNRTLIEAARTMLADSKLPTMFWTEAVSTACYVLNRVSITNPHNKTPYELISGKVPQISHLKPFGCQVTILNTSDYLGKFEGKADDGYLVGYASNSKAYRVYNLPNKRVEETLNLRFLEDKPNVQGIGHEWYFDLDYLTDSLGYTRFKTDTPAGTQETNINAGTQDHDSDSEVDEQVIVVPSFPSNRFAGPSSSNGPSIMERNADYAEELAKLQRQEYEAKDAAARYGYLFSQATAEILCQAEAEIRNQGVSAVTDPAGIDSAVREPAGIVSADGVSTGSPSADSDPAGVILLVYTSSWFNLWIGVKTLNDFQSLSDVCKAQLLVWNLHIGHRQEEGIDYDELDVKSAFLYGEIEEEYVNQPKGLEDPFLPKACIQSGLKVCNGLLSKHLEPDTRDILLVQVYVDDIIFGSTNKAWCDEFEVLMKGEFEMSAIGEMTFFLGLQVKQLPDGIFISQDKYVKDMLTKFDMESVRTATTPYEAAKTKLKDETDPPVNVHLYRSMIGSLMYLTASRPDIMFAVSACSRHQVTPLTSHLNAVKKIFKYLKGQPKLGLWYPKDSPFQLEAYSDMLCTIVLWFRTRCWIMDLTYEFQNLHRKTRAIICIVKQLPVFHQRTKHIEIRHHFIRDANEKNLIQVLKIHTDDNVADLLTKAFDGPRFAYLVVHIGMVDNTAARCTFFLLTGLVSAGSTMVLLVAILSAGRLVSAVILPAGRMVSAGCTMVLLSLHSDDVEEFWRTQDEWVVSSWKLYPKSSVHVLDLTNGKTVYMFVDKVYPIRATLLERMLRHRLTVPPSYCRDVVVAGNIIQTVQTGLRQSYECLASAPICSFLLEDLEAVSADYVPAGHVLISADRYRIC
ncbi:putative ribonuclease H-like domain-containing protein [Tanacetum coccineum]|uniref:Ribonuclease H-like domain-containing protein n=1 Tax=Tanacetum coccineum TaxID=301880 RepID=A0ABQ4ZYB0_9ASTR